MKKSIKGRIKDRLIITTTTTRAHFSLRIARVNSSNLFLGVTVIMKLAGALCRGVLVKDNAVNKKWIDK